MKKLRIALPFLCACILLGSFILLHSLKPARPAEDLFANQAGLPPVKIIASSTKQTLNFSEFVTKLSEYDVICVGEQHDQPLHHLIQENIIRGLYTKDKRLGVGLEMFQRPFQPSLDRYLAGTTTEAEFLKESEYDTRWGFDFKLYRPILEFCRTSQIPLGALNAPSELTKRISKVGYAGLTDAEKQQLGPVDFNVQAHRQYWYDQLGQMHGDSKPSEERKERTYQVMTVWDDYMAQSGAAFKTERKLARLVVLAGGGHIEHRFGIPDRIARYGKSTVATVGIVIVDDATEEQEALAMGFDYIICIKNQPLP
jgi:uncharacterized iron-regulated protein